MEFSLWENLLLGVMLVGIILWMRPGIKSSMQQTRDAKSDWMGALVPIGFVVMFVVFLIAMV
jgi:TRAP-type C4-dicarboxylate transport system permease small subunit